MKLIVHRGAKQIGGSCVELATARTRLIVDAGLPLADLDSPTRPRLRRDAPLPDGLAPPVPGLFAPGPNVDAILLSHAHSDHSGLLAHTPADVLIYLTSGTSKMMLAGSLFAGQTEVPRERQRTLSAGCVVQIGDFRVTAFPVDHSTYDGVALLIEAGGVRVLYSGDLRLHGRRQSLAPALLKAIQLRPIDALLMEGTHFSGSRERGPTEQELEDEIFAHICSAPGLVLAMFSPLHVDRLLSFYQAARRSGRVLVLDPYGAFVLHLIDGRDGLPHPREQEGVRVVFNEGFEKSKAGRIEKVRCIASPARIEMAEMLAQPERHVMLFRETMLKSDFGGTLPARSRCIYSLWSGYLSQPKLAALKAHFPIIEGDFVECHTSGHIFRDDIERFVAAVNPREVIPIHTNSPDAFAAAIPRTRLVTDGVEYKIGGK